MKKIIIAVMVILVAGCAGIYAFIATDSSDYYYTQIDNSKMEKTDFNGGVINFEGSLPYSYKLTCYDKNGRKKNLQFTAEKKLRDNAFIRLEVKSVRGVISWNEVWYDELPEAVQKKY
ncbi:MAG: YxeA family protein [Ruminococcus flavefaciens]|nr:YxeA family protein [Ruminococcus flavefaciens]MCM1231042.1 YxeA family protein [Ruminococcus flavefaciens]